jgi:uncharacterized surface protein with fasciclin (FAS1) repeats
MKKRLFLRSVSLVAVMVLSACASTPQPATIAETAARTPQLSTLSRLIGQAGLGETLQGAGPFTVFAPSDDAFKAVPAETLAKLAADKELLKSVLTYHVLPGKVTSAELKSGPAKTVQGASVALSKAGTFVTIEDAVVVTADVPATNGVIHIVDRVLMPPKR